MDQAFGCGDAQAVLDRVTDDVGWSTDAVIVSAAWFGSQPGKDQPAGFFTGVVRTGPVTTFTPAGLQRPRRRCHGVHPVRLHGHRLGKHVATNMYRYWKFRDGRAGYVRSSEDTAQVTAAPTL